MSARQPNGSGAGGDVGYIFPRHPSEVDRLDLQHFALREALGSNYLAPLPRPARVLDVGCGTGQWAIDLCEQFPEALVVGLDIEVRKPQRAANYRFVRSNVLQGLPFQAGRFDFVHQRLLGPGVPLKAWPGVVRDLVRVGRPGSWIEVVEGEFALEPAGPATVQLFGLARQLASQMGLDTTSTAFRSLGEYLSRAGASNVQTQHLEVPVGEWGGRIGSFMASDFRAAFLRLTAPFQDRLSVSAEVVHVLLKTMQQEWEEHQSRWTLAFAFGQNEG
jgi:ubiquinone/menaquinone biosynthesis C-methylase UbiE